MQITFDTQNVEDLKKMRLIIDALYPSEVTTNEPKKTRRSKTKKEEPEKKATQNEVDLEELREELRNLLRQKSKNHRSEIKAFLNDLGVASITAMSDIQHFKDTKSFLENL